MTIHRQIIVFLAAASIAVSAGTSQTKLYVAKNGNDSWSGTLPAPNVMGTDGPWASLGHAATAVKEMQADGGTHLGGGVTEPKVKGARQQGAKQPVMEVTAGVNRGAGQSLRRNVMRDKRNVAPVIVEVRAGIYELDSTLVLAKLRSVTWRPYKDEKVSITGSRAIHATTPIRDPAIRELIRPSLRDSIVEIDLRANGVVDAGEIVPRGGPALQLFSGSTVMKLARYPREGWLLVADVPQSGDSLYNKGLDREKRFYNVPVGRHYGRITYDIDRPGEWSGMNEILMQGYWTWDWSDSFQKVKMIDARKHEIEIQTPHHGYGYTKNQHYCFYNVLEELAAPGEWCINRAAMKVYAYPFPAHGTNELRVSVLAGPLIIADSCSTVRIEGFTIAESRGKGVVIRGGSNVSVDGCELTHVGDCAVTIEGGMQNGVSGCTLHDCALGAITLGGGDRESLTPAHNYAENNHIHHYSQWLLTGQYAVWTTGVGNRVAHNLIHDAPFEAMYLSGNDHIVEYNEVHHVTQESGDAGALHTGRDWTWRGNIIRYNYFHHLQGKGLHGVMGVYLDDWASGFTVTGNIFYKAGRATMIGGGRDNVVENNIYIECSPSIHIDARGIGWGSYYFDGTYPDLFTKMNAMNYSQPPYSTRYPELLTLYKDDPALPKHNIIRNNVSYGGRFMDVYDYNAFDFRMVTVTGNIIADTAVMRRRNAGLAGWDPYYLNIDYVEGYHTFTSREPSIRAELKGNVFYDGNPFFVGAAGRSFKLKKIFPAGSTGFNDIPFERIGLLPAKK
jgi:hypothetical protein